MPATSPTMEQIPLPDWLVAIERDDENKDYPRTKEDRQLREILFQTVFERVLEEVSSGGKMIDVIDNYPTKINRGQFMAWVKRDSERWESFEDAKHTGSLFHEEENIRIADGGETMEDINRSKERINSRKLSMQSWNRRYKTDNKEISNPFAGGVTIVIGEVESPYKNSRVIENGES
jgi:hypothetical protein